VPEVGRQLLNYNSAAGLDPHTKKPFDRGITWISFKKRRFPTIGRLIIDLDRYPILLFVIDRDET
jgi:hypothetical protein